VCHWHNNTYPTVNFLTFGTTGSVNVRVTKIGSPVTAIEVSPHSKGIPVQIVGGAAVLTLNQNNKVWITLDGDDANPLFIFADAPKPPVPAGATYVGPGVVNVPGEGHYKPSNNQIIYLSTEAPGSAATSISGERPACRSSDRAFLRATRFWAST
jgi:hypothetical protein